MCGRTLTCTCAHARSRGYACTRTHSLMCMHTNTGEACCASVAVLNIHAVQVSTLMRVRAAVGEFPRSFASNPPNGAAGAVLDGRDVGTVLLPHAHLKLFITASDEVWAAAVAPAASCMPLARRPCLARMRLGRACRMLVPMRMTCTGTCTTCMGKPDGRWLQSPHFIVGRA